MADKKPDAPAASAPKKLAPAAESGDAAVHDLLARRDIALQNDDQDAVGEIDKQLADAGVQA